LTSNILSINNLSVIRNENFSLKIKKLQLDSGVILGLIGNNGSGKTTFYLSLLNLLDYSNGKIELFKKSWKHDDIYIKKNIGVYLDASYLIDYLTINEYFQLLAKAFNDSLANYMQRAKDYMDIFKIQFTDNQLIRELSQGNQIKIGLIASILHRPKLVLWDEPLANLDPLSRASLIELTLKIKEENKTSFIISSHNINELFEFSDYFLCLERGKVTGNGTKNQFSNTDLLNLLGIN